MIIEEGYVYHVKNEYFEFVNDEKLMRNHEGDATRPNYFCLKMEDEEIMCFAFGDIFKNIFQLCSVICIHNSAIVTYSSIA